MRVARDGTVLAASALHGALVAALALSGASGVAPAVLVAVLLAWGANTVAHIHLHTPLFRARLASRALSLYLTALLGFPQTLWRQRHLAHHAGARADRLPRPRTSAVALELALVALTFAALVALSPAFALGAWLPGLAGGLALCSLQGRMEHARGEQAGVSCYGRLHNALWFNDGFHVEHHRWPGLHWTELPRRRLASAPASRLPPWLRGLAGLGDAVAGGLDALERLVLRSRWLQRRLVETHRAATARVLTRAPRAVLIVGGGLFPRSVRVFRALAPEARLAVVDAAADHLERARRSLADDDAEPDAGPPIAWTVGRWSASEPAPDCDLVVVPLAFRGARAELMRPGPVARLVHTWLWTRTPHPRARVAWWLLKQVVLVPAAAPEAVASA
ncbi:MAG: fatty acid desaturase [Myxococcota bacterium]